MLCIVSTIFNRLPCPMQNLEQIGFDFFLKGNGQIEDLVPLENLKKIFGNIIIDGNNALKTLEGLSGLTDMGRSLSIICTRAQYRTLLQVCSTAVVVRVCLLDQFLCSSSNSICS